VACCRACQRCEHANSERAPRLTHFAGASLLDTAAKRASDEQQRSQQAMPRRSPAAAPRFPPGASWTFRRPAAADRRRRRPRDPRPRARRAGREPGSPRGGRAQTASWLADACPPLPCRRRARARPRARGPRHSPGVTTPSSQRACVASAAPPGRQHCWRGRPAALRRWRQRRRPALRRWRQRRAGRGLPPVAPSRAPAWPRLRWQRWGCFSSPPLAARRAAWRRHQPLLGGAGAAQSTAWRRRRQPLQGRAVTARRGLVRAWMPPLRLAGHPRADNVSNTRANPPRTAHHGRLRQNDCIAARGSAQRLCLLLLLLRRWRRRRRGHNLLLLLLVEGVAEGRGTAHKQRGRCPLVFVVGVAATAATVVVACICTRVELRLEGGRRGRRCLSGSERLPIALETEQLAVTQRAHALSKRGCLLCARARSG
jgi:hypothetical protein